MSARVEVTRRVRFEAGHYLPDHPGACRNLHGHSFYAWLTVAGMVKAGGPEDGMVVDMGALGSWWKRTLEPQLDHAVLNDVLDPYFLPPSTENLALYLGAEARASGFNVVRVVVQETENQTATAYWPELEPGQEWAEKMTAHAQPEAPEMRHGGGMGRLLSEAEISEAEAKRGGRRL